MISKTANIFFISQHSSISRWKQAFGIPPNLHVCSAQFTLSVGACDISSQQEWQTKMKGAKRNITTEKQVDSGEIRHPGFLHVIKFLKNAH